MGKIKVTKEKSAINRTNKQKLTLKALGLKKIGQTVEHKKFGVGTIQDIDGTKAIVDFDKHGKKKLISDFLKPC